MPPAAAMPVTLRKVEADDEGFLCGVYASTRWEELGPTGWSDGEKVAFLESQFRAQHAWYAENFVDAAFDVILVRDVPAGRLYVRRAPDEIRLVDIALLPGFRGSGIGTALLRELQDEAATARKPLRIHVEKMNPAARLYERLGFRKIEDRGVYDFLEWRPSAEAVS